MKRMSEPRRSLPMPAAPATATRLALVACALLVPIVAVVANRDKVFDDRVVVILIAALATAAATWRVFRALRASATSESRLAYQATHDALTGLPNRKLILDRIEQMQKRGRRTGHDGAVLFIDLDRFKDVNDSLGHRVGDDVLRQTAIRFQGALREADSIGRLGGDEFVVLVEGSATQAEAAARRLLESLTAPFAVHSAARPQLTIAASIGIVSGAYASAEDLLMDADVALYEAKAAGRNRAVRFEPHMRGEFRTRIELERDLRLALEGGQFFLVYQPVIGLRDGTVQSVEALLRWRRP